MNHSYAARLLAIIMAAGMLLTTFSFAVSAADESGGQKGTTSIASLTELLSVDKYTAYKVRYRDVARAAQTVTIDATDFSAENTTASIGNGDTDVRIVEYADMDNDGNYVSGTEQKGLYCPDAGAVGWEVDIPETGMYAISIEYYPVEGKVTSIQRTLYIDGKVPFYEARFLTFTKVWSDVYDSGYDGTRDTAFTKDILGNEIKPDKIQTPVWRNYDFTDSTGNVTEALEFYLEKGTHVLQLEAQSEAFALKSITFYPYEECTSYEEYLNRYSDADYVSSAEVAAVSGNGDEGIKVEAELYENTSEISIYPLHDSSSPITSPQGVSGQLRNYIGSSNWESPGQWVSWRVTVPRSGLYKIGARCVQSATLGLFSSRIIRINGEIPFEEAKNLMFTAADTWQAYYLSDGSEEHADGFYFYLEEGENVIELEATIGKMSDIVLRLSNIIDTANQAYTNIRMITGANPDSNRDYNFYKLIPSSINDLAEAAEELYEIAASLDEISGASDTVSSLESVARTMQKMGSKEEEVAKNLQSLKSDIGNLGDWLYVAMLSPLSLDYFTIQGTDAGQKQLPKAKENFAQSLWYELRMFANSFITDYDTLGALEEVDEDEAVEVWTTSGRDQANIIRNLINNNFTPKTGINVSLKLVAEGTLLPSILAGIGPDVSMDAKSSDVINWAIRGAVMPLDEFGGFDEIVSEFPDASIVPLRLYSDDIEDYNAGEHGKITDDETTYATYALPMTLDFYMMFYRADVFQRLGLEAPKTWEDFYAILPVLQNNQMEAALPVDFEGTKVFLYQYLDEGTSVRDGLYADNGRRIGLDSNRALQAFDDLCSLFTQYGLPIAYSFENRFRTGEMPIGVVLYSSYTQISVFSPEIKGLWEFVPLPGYKTEDGTINNTSPVKVTGIIMPRGNRTEEKANDAWEFMKWYVGHENQADYATEYTTLLGSQSKFTTANREALQEMPWSTSERQNLMAQFDKLSGIPEFPGSYIIERNVQFAFRNVYNNNEDPVTSMLSYITDINKEISRKREEFNLDYYEITYSSSFTESEQR